MAGEKKKNSKSKSSFSETDNFPTPLGICWVQLGLGDIIPAGPLPTSSTSTSQTQTPKKSIHSERSLSISRYLNYKVLSSPPLPPCPHSPVLGLAHSQRQGRGGADLKKNNTKPAALPRNRNRTANGLTVYTNISNHIKKYSTLSSPANCIFCTALWTVNITGRIITVTGRPLKMRARSIAPKYFC